MWIALLGKLQGVKALTAVALDSLFPLNPLGLLPEGNQKSNVNQMIKDCYRYSYMVTVLCYWFKVITTDFSNLLFYLHFIPGWNRYSEQVENMYFFYCINCSIFLLLYWYLYDYLIEFLFVVKRKSDGLFLLILFILAQNSWNSLFKNKFYM